MIHVTESFKFSNGFIIVFLQWSDGKLPEGTLLEDIDKKKWRIKRHHWSTTSIAGAQLREQREASNIYEYGLESVDHEEKPQKDTMLRIV